MKTRKEALLAALLLTGAPAALLAQTAPVIVQAESGAVGAAFARTTQGADTYITIAPTVGGGNPATPDRVASYTVTFPAPGTYELYARLRVGSATFNADSMYYGNGFGAKTVSADTTADGDWILVNNLANAVGYNLPADKVVDGGDATNGVFKWVKMSVYNGGEAPVASWVVTADALTQTFQIGGRETGLDLDKFAFGVQGIFYTVDDLDNDLPGDTIPPPPPFTPTGPPIATGQTKFLGDAYSPPQATSFTAYWNQVTPENAGKWGSAEATRGTFVWTDLDTAYQVAKSNGFPFKMHNLVWGQQQPAWIETLSPADQLTEIQTWFGAVAARYPGIDLIDVVNEPLHNPPNHTGNGGGNYIDALGGAGATGWDWVINAFRLARADFPSAKLLINEFGVSNDMTEMQQYIQIIKLLQAQGLIDGVGVQAHAFETRTDAATQKANLDLLAATGLPIYISEMDIDGLTDEAQLADYQRIFPVFWEHPAVKGVTLWGFRIGHWRTAEGDYLVLSNGAERPALVWLKNYVPDVPPVITAGQKFTIAENSAAGSVVGTVLATDVDSGQTLSNWTITGGSGSAVFTIDPQSGRLSLASGQVIDFEATTSYGLTLTVFDGYKTSAPSGITVNVTNVNDNPPVVRAGQTFPIDGGVRNLIGVARATDADDTNQAGFTTFQNWRVAGGTGASVLGIDMATGAIGVTRPLLVDFKKASYTLLVTVSDGATTSAPQTLSITIPNRVHTCLLGFVDVTVPKDDAKILLLLGASLGSCRR